MDVIRHLGPRRATNASEIRKLLPARSLVTIEHFDPVGCGLGGGCAWEILDNLPEVFQGRVSLAVFVEVLGNAAARLPREWLT